jgi:hypothetical protein
MGVTNRIKGILMSESHDPYHRLGEPGGPGCEVTALPIQFKQPDGTSGSGHLLDAGPDASELELLRTVAQGLGVKWGVDQHGWWAVVT